MQLDPLSIDVNKYLGCSRSRKSEIVCLVEDRLRGKFIKLPSRNEQLPLPTFLHLKTELEFTWIPSGTLEMGLSIEEEEAALALASPQLLLRHRIVEHLYCCDRMNQYDNETGCAEAGCPGQGRLAASGGARGFARRAE
jgi:hypothetical protein